MRRRETWYTDNVITQIPPSFVLIHSSKQTFLSLSQEGEEKNRIHESE